MTVAPGCESPGGPEGENGLVKDRSVLIFIKLSRCGFAKRPVIRKKWKAVAEIVKRVAAVQR